MSWLRGQGRLADLSFFGAVAGFVVSLIVSAILLGLSLRNDRREGGGCMGCSCLMRLVALLVLTLGMGAGYMIGRSMGK